MIPEPEARTELSSQPLWAIFHNRRLWLGAALGVACLVLAMANIDYVEVAEALRSAKPVWVGVAAVTVLLTGGAKAWRWQLLLYPERQTRPAGAIRLPRLANIWMAGTGVNLALPVPRAGDVLRVYLVGEAGKASKSQVLGTIAAEKLLDMVLLAVCFMGLLLFMAMPEELAQRQISTLGVTSLAVIVVAGMLWQRQRVLAVAAKLLQYLPYGHKLGDSIDCSTRTKLKLPVFGKAPISIEGSISKLLAKMIGITPD